MANALVVRRGTQLEKNQRASRAAQYVRMSTDGQRYSIENQAAVIATHARVNNLSIVKTYRDEGESGLRLKNRAGLIQMLDDVQSERADFGHILVYDVSRWGRFQDTDESAHYEFLCKQAGIKVTYCAEQFDNDGTMLSSIVKNLKRVMAAEYSRELSARVHAGACRLSRLGFKIGGKACYALDRVLVDEAQRPKGILKNGERKYLITDHVRLRPGTTDEVAVVRWIFARFLETKSETAIARELNLKGVPHPTLKRWTRVPIGQILRNENYIGNVIYNRRSKKLGEKTVYNGPDLWVRGEGCVEPIIERDIFLRANKIIEERRVDLSESEMLVRLRKTLAKRRKLTPAIINETVGLPCTATYVKHFGDLRKLYRLIGYTPSRNFEYLDAQERWSSVIAEHAKKVSACIERRGWRVELDERTNCVRLNSRESISFRLAKWQPGQKPGHAPYWSIKRRVRLPPGWIIAIRLNEHNKDVLDYILLKTTDISFGLMRFTERARGRRGIANYPTLELLLRSLSRRLETTRPATQRNKKPPPG